MLLRKQWLACKQTRDVTCTTLNTLHSAASLRHRSQGLSALTSALTQSCWPSEFVLPGTNRLSAANVYRKSCELLYCLPRSTQPRDRTMCTNLDVKRRLIILCVRTMGIEFFSDFVYKVSYLVIKKITKYWYLRFLFVVFGWLGEGGAKSPARRKNIIRLIELLKTVRYSNFDRFLFRTHL